MILVNAWLEWGLRVVVLGWIVGGGMWHAGPPAYWEFSWSPVVVGLVFFLMERQWRKHRCWVVTGGEDVGVLRDFYRGDAARRYQPFPSQKEAFLQLTREMPAGWSGPPAGAPGEMAMEAVVPEDGGEADPELGEGEAESADLPPLDLEVSAREEADDRKSDATEKDLPSFPL